MSTNKTAQNKNIIGRPPLEIPKHKVTDSWQMHDGTNLPSTIKNHPF